jgi:hypothetical protein
LCPVQATLAWGDTGHRIVCEIAFQELSDTARQGVKRLIRLNHESADSQTRAPGRTTRGSAPTSTT